MSITGSLFPSAAGKRVEEGGSNGSPKSSGRQSVRVADDGLAVVGGGGQGVSYYLLLCLQGLTGGSLAVLLSALLFLLLLLPVLRNCGAQPWFAGDRGAGGHAFAPVPAWSVMQCVLAGQGGAERARACKSAGAAGDPHAEAGGSCPTEAALEGLDGGDGTEAWVVSLVWTLVAINLICSAAAAMWALSDFAVCSGSPP